VEGRGQEEVTLLPNSRHSSLSKVVDDSEGRNNILVLKEVKKRLPDKEPNNWSVHDQIFIKRGRKRAE
jgi:hypothetical protein